MYAYFPRNYKRQSPTGLYSMLIQNTASREVFIFDELDNISANPLYYTFDIQMPENAQAGEYTYYLIPDPSPLLNPDIQYFVQADGYPNMAGTNVGVNYQDAENDQDRAYWVFVYDGKADAYRIYNYYMDEARQYPLTTTAGSTNLKRQQGDGTLFKVTKNSETGQFRIAFHSDRPTRYIGYNMQYSRYSMYMDGQSQQIVDLQIIAGGGTTVQTIEPDTQPLLSKVTQADGTTVLLRDLRPEIGLLMYKTTNDDPNVYPETQSSFIYYDGQ